MRRALRLEYLTVAWNIVEGLVAVTAAMIAGSVAILGFRIDSFVECASAVVMIWRLRVEHDHRTTEARLATIDRVARQLGSEAVHADAAQTTACWWLSVAALVGVGLNGFFGWWWADPVAAFVIASLIVCEGREAWNGKACC